MLFALLLVNALAFFLCTLIKVTQNLDVGEFGKKTIPVSSLRGWSGRDVGHVSVSA